MLSLPRSNALVIQAAATALLLGGAASAQVNVGPSTIAPVGQGQAVAPSINTVGSVPVGAPAVGLPPGLSASGVSPTTIGVDDDEAPTNGLSFLSAVGLNFDADLSVEYESNLLRLGASQPLGAGRASRSDFRLRPSVGVQGGLPVGRQQLFLNARYGRDILLRNKALNAERFRIDGGVIWALGARCGGRVQASYSQRQGQLDLFEEVRDNVQKRVNLLASLACPGPVGLSPTASVEFSRVDNVLAERRRFDARSFSGRAGLVYVLPGRGSLQLNGTYGYSRFPNNTLAEVQLIRPAQLPDGSTVPVLLPPIVLPGDFLADAQPLIVLTPPDFAGTRFYSVDLAGNYRIGPSLQVQAGVGYNRTKPRLRFQDGYSGPLFNFGLIYYGPRLSGSATVARSVTGAAGGTSQFFVTTSYALAASYRLGNGIGVQAGLSRNQRSFRGDLGVEEGSALPRRSRENFDRVFIFADKQIGRLLSVSLGYTHHRRRADPALYDFDSDGVRLRLGVAF